jgi:hypothetical protein
MATGAVGSQSSGLRHPGGAFRTISLSPGNEIPSQPLAQWPPARSTPRPVGGASGPPGTPDDTWESVAKSVGMDPHLLIIFNFGTNSPKMVNWYLRTYVGCVTPSQTGWNWAFKGAIPGIIYLPIQIIDVTDGENLHVGPGQRDRKWLAPDFSLKDSDLAKTLDDLGKNIPGPGKYVYQGVKYLLWVTVGKPLSDSVKQNSENEYFWGVCHGIVLGNDDRTWDNIKTWNFTGTTRSAAIAGDPEFRPLYAKAYQAGLVQGLDYANQMNDDQRNRLNRAIRSKLDMRNYPPLTDRVAWFGRDDMKRAYYADAAIVFRRYLLNPYLKNGTLQAFLQAHY